MRAKDLLLLTVAPVLITGCNVQFIPSTVLPGTNLGAYPIPERNDGYMRSHFRDINRPWSMSASGGQGPATLIRDLRLPEMSVIPPLPASHQPFVYCYSYGRTPFAVHIRLIRINRESRERTIVAECKFPNRTGITD